MVSVVCSLFFVFFFFWVENKGYFNTPKGFNTPKAVWVGFLSSFVIQCAVAKNEAVANDVYKLRLRAQQLMLY